MKKIILALVSVVGFATTSFAQEQYIEVVVQDTLLLEPKQWLYNASLQNNYETTVMIDTMPMTRDYTAPATKPKTKHTSIEEVTALAKKYNGRLPEAISIPDYTVVAHTVYTADAVTFVFTDRQSLNDFSKAVAALKDVEGKLVGAYNSDLQQEYTRLNARLIASARMRAENLAQLSGRKLGIVLQVSENTEGTTNAFKEFLESMIKYDGPGRRAELYNFRPDKIKLEKALKVRFALL